MYSAPTMFDHGNFVIQTTSAGGAITEESENSGHLESADTATAGSTGTTEGSQD
jgi:hypothetical protein